MKFIFSEKNKTTKKKSNKKKQNQAFLSFQPLQKEAMRFNLNDIFDGSRCFMPSEVVVGAPDEFDFIDENFDSLSGDRDVKIDMEKKEEDHSTQEMNAEELQQQ